MSVRYNLLCFLIIVLSAGLVDAQEASSCYGAGSIATSVVLTFILTALLVGALLYVWNKFRGKKGKSILVKNVEKIVPGNLKISLKIV